MTENIMFKPIRGSRFNARVGNNGYISYREYSKGFSKAANKLIDSILESKEHQSEINDALDTLVYPICLNMRHAVELYIKASYEIFLEAKKNTFKKSNINIEKKNT